jgi:aspartate/methionine/tyrosine aminotransferase
MISLRARKQMNADLTHFFKDFKEYDTVENSYNLGLGEIICKNRLLDELGQYSDIITKRISKFSSFYPGCQGYRPLNEKIAELIKLETKQEISPDEIILTSGAYDGLTQAVFTYADHGDKVMFPVPSFPYWSNTTRCITGYKAIFCRNQEAFNHLGDMFEEQLDKNTSLFILNTPHNPLGAFLPKEQACKIDELAQRNKIKIVLDDVYRAFSTRKWIGSCFDLDNTIIVDSFSKRFGMPGLRLGFVRVPKEELPYFRASVANQYVGVSLVSAVIADIVLTLHLNDKCLNNVPREIARRQEKLDAALCNVSPKPAGGMFRIVPCTDSMKACDMLLKHNIRVTSGRACFPNDFQGNEFIRLSVGGEPRIKEAARRLAEVIENNKPLFTEHEEIVEEIVI